MVLPEDRFGPSAVSRGDGSTRLLTLRNLTWEPVTYDVPLDQGIGLESGDVVHVRRFHPRERGLGEFDFGTSQPAAVTIVNESTDGYLVVDAVQWIAK